MSEQSVREIIYSIVKVEEAGARFYSRLASEVRNQAAKLVFLDLVKDEVRHQHDFELMINELKDKPLVLSSATNLADILSNTTNTILRLMEGAELIDMEDANLQSALNIGIQNEKDAIRVYSALLGVRYAGFSQLIQRVIDEEKKHLASLEFLKSRLLG